MASTSACTRQLEELDLSDPSCMMDVLSNSKYVTAVATGSENAITFSSTNFLSARGESILESGERISVEQQIENSKAHWSQLTELDSNSNDDEVAADNREVLEKLQMHPTWGYMFCTFGYETELYPSLGELEVGEKFAEGGQAELFHAHITWNVPELSEEDMIEGYEWVLKVFSKGTLLRHLQSQWPHGMFLYKEEMQEFHNLGKRPPIVYVHDVKFGTLLKDGRFAFLTRREGEDLRSLIDRKMLSITHDHGPFSKEFAESLLYDIALGMEWLHGHNIIHRDLKASNVLFSEYEEGREESWACLIADFECSVGVTGTGFWRAPEILQACKEKNVSRRPELFTKEADVYSYGMTCYEILTGKVPCEGHPIHEYDLVLEGHQLVVPEFVDDWAHKLLRRCWQLDLAARPTFEEILGLLLVNSAAVRELEERRKGFHTFTHSRLKNRA